MNQKHIIQTMWNTWMKTNALYERYAEEKLMPLNQMEHNVFEVLGEEKMARLNEYNASYNLIFEQNLEAHLS